jgi:hypothetical protein
MGRLLRIVVTSSVVLGLLFYVSASLATSTARTGWYVVGSGFGIFSASAPHLQDGFADAKAEIDKQAKADAKAKAKP